MSDADSINEAEVKRVRDAVLSARHLVLERELEAAPYHKVGTSWWDERIEEMRLIDYRLGK